MMACLGATEKRRPRGGIKAGGLIKGEADVPKLTVEGFGTFDVERGKRLVLAIEQDAHVDILHACGGNARCTTCRVEFIAGEPERHTAAEQEKLTSRQLTG